MQLSWVIYLGSHEAAIKMSARTGISSRDWTGEESASPLARLFTTFTPSSQWLRASGFLLALSRAALSFKRPPAFPATGASPTCPPTSPSHQRVSRARLLASRVYIRKHNHRVTSQQLCCILLVRSRSGPAHTQGEVISQRCELEEVRSCTTTQVFVTMTLTSHLAHSSFFAIKTRTPTAQ